MKVKKIIALIILLMLIVIFIKIFTINNKTETTNFNYVKNIEQVSKVKEPEKEYNCKIETYINCPNSIANYPYPFIEKLAVIYGDGSEEIKDLSLGLAQCTNVIITKHNQVDNYLSLNSNLIVIGSPCLNKISAQILGLNYPTCGDNMGIKNGESRILLKNFYGNKYALIVYGYTQEDTNRALELLRDPEIIRKKLRETGRECKTEFKIQTKSLDVNGVTIS